MNKTLLYNLLVDISYFKMMEYQNGAYASEIGSLSESFSVARIHNPEGYVDNTYNANSPQFFYYRKDHLGNNRQVWNATTNTTVQKMRYYPSGLPNYYYASSPSLQPYTFNGKEFIDAHGLDVTDLGWRSVYSAINRFTSPDRFAEKTPWQSPYAHANNNSVNFVDVGGDSVNVTNKDGDFLFMLNDGNETITNINAKQLYNKGIQWFAPTADNYMPIITMADNITTSNSLKHFSSEDIMTFAETDRWMIEYRQGGSGDWKKSKQGADGYLMVTVDGQPYWADAIGQVPFAIDKFTDVLLKTGNADAAAAQTIEAGKKYGDGNIFSPTRDDTNGYDNYMIQKTVSWAAKSYELGRNIFGNRVVDRNKSYSPASQLFKF